MRCETEEKICTDKDLNTKLFIARLLKGLLWHRCRKSSENANSTREKQTRWTFKIENKTRKLQNCRVWTDDE